MASPTASTGSHQAVGEPQRRYDERRSIIFFASAIMALASASSQLLTNRQHPFEVAWELGSVVVCGLTGVLARHPRERVRVLAMGGLAVFFVVTTPLVVSAGSGPTSLVVLLGLPLALTIIFMDQVAVVTAICATGVVVNVATLVSLDWAGGDVVHAAASMIALYGAGILGSLEFRGLARREREHQEHLRRASALQLQSERLVVLGTLAAGVAHEINNPLAYVTANLQHLKESDGAVRDAERAQIWHEAESGLRRIGAIVADLKGLARAAPNGVEALDLQRLLRQTARLTSLRGRGLRVETHIEDDLPAAMADEQRLAQVLINLAVNACDALEEARPAAPVVRLSAARDGERVVISVEDNGAGVPAEVKAQLFTPFFTTKAPGHGTGLGLALSREYLQAFGGRIWCDTSTLGGARFRVSLPVEASPASGP